MQKTFNHDTIIIGGGMVGMALACALASDKRVALVDAAALAKPDDHRLIALNYNSYCLLKNLGVWEALAPLATAIDALHVSHHGHFGVTRLNASECNLPVLGYVVPAHHIEAALAARIATLPAITCYRPATLKAFSDTTDGVQADISLRTETLSLTAKLLIGADGTHSTVRRLANIKTAITDYQQTAIVTVTTLQRAHDHTAYERFHGNGAIAMLPLAGNVAATIWTEDNATVKKLLQLSDNDFLATLQKEFGYRLGRFLATGTRHSYPLQLQTAQQGFSGNVVLVGNAAHTLHPVAAQGLNLALAEIAMLAQTLADLDAPAWQAYRTWQAQLLANSLRLSHDLLQIFALDFTPVAVARQTGMLTLNLCPPLKRRFALRASGRHIPLPALLLDQGLE